jgi:hypothetical protein
MPGILRIEYEGAVSHVTSRGDRGEAVYPVDRYREVFLETLAQAYGRTGWAEMFLQKPHEADDDGEMTVFEAAVACVTRS